MEGVKYASTILTRAVTLDMNSKHTESLVCYQEGIQILMDALKNITDESQKEKVRGKVEEYMERAEKVKKHIEKLKDEGEYREQLVIEEGSTGYSYDKIFTRFLEPTVHRLEIDDPYIRSVHQCDNFLRFVELCLKLCPNLKVIFLQTKQDDNASSDQKIRLDTISRSVASFTKRQVTLQIHYSDTLHDREIRLDNGWVIKIGRGLDYFKPVDRNTIGWTDYFFRPCRATTIDIFHRKDLHKVK